MPTLMRSLRFTAGLVVVLAASVFSFSKDAPQPDAIQQRTQRVEETAETIRTNTRLVIVDVVATDSHGNPVKDLKQDDFSILEDSKPQTIGSFSFREGKATQAAVRRSTPGVFENAPTYTRSSSLNVILLDSLNGGFAAHSYGRDQLLKYLDTSHPIQPTALYVLDKKLTLLSDFTTDATRLKAVLADYKPKGPVHIQNVYAAASPFTTSNPDVNISVKNMELTVGALNRLAQALAGYPGRKNLIWVSEAFPITPYPEIIDNQMVPFVQSPVPGPAADPSSGPPSFVGAITHSFSMTDHKDFAKEVEKVSNAMMAAQVAIYPIDAAGLSKDNRLNSTTTMESMAQATGGRAFHHGNDVEGGIRQSMDDGSTYYTLTYYPKSKDWNGKLRLIQVKTSRAGVKLHYRRGYYALDPKTREKKEEKALGEDFSQAMGLDSPTSTAVQFKAQVAQKKPKLLVKFAIDPHTLVFNQKDGGRQQAAISCAVFVYSEKGSLVKQEINSQYSTVRAADFPKLMKSALGCERSVALKPGNYNLVLGVVDRYSRLMGTTTAWVHLP